MDDSEQSRWNKSRHRRGYCEMHICTAQYFRRLWVLLLSAFPSISAWLFIAAAHTSDQEAADKQAWSLLPARASVLHAHSLLASKQDCPIYILVCCPLKWVGGKRACTLVAGTQDIAKRKQLYSLWRTNRTIIVYISWSRKSQATKFFPVAPNICVSSYGACVLLSLRRLEFWGRTSIFVKILNP